MGHNNIKTTERYVHIADTFKSKYPDMYLEYKQLCKENKFCPGDVFDMIMAMDIYITLVLKQRGEHELK